MFRILTKLPYSFLLACSLILLFLTAFLFPFGTESDSQILNLIANKDSWNFRDSINVHNIFSYFIYLILDSYEIRSFYGYRFLNLIYFSLLIFTLYKIIKLQFYDLKIFPVLTAITSTGVILISFISLQGFLFTGLISLIIFYFQIKIFIEEKTYNGFFFRSILYYRPIAGQLFLFINSNNSIITKIIRLENRKK